MLPKNRLSAFILSVIFIAAAFAGYWLVFDPTFQKSRELVSQPWQIALLVLIFGGLAFGLSRSWMMALDPAEGYGWRGLVRWFFCGLLEGIMLILFQKGVLERIPEHSFFKPMVELVGGLGLFWLVYWVIFRQNPMKVNNQSKSSSAEVFGYERWLLISVGVLLTGGGWGTLLNSSRGLQKVTWLASGEIMLGLSLVLMGLFLPSGKSERQYDWVGLVSAGLMVMGGVAAAIGLLMP